MDSSYEEEIVQDDDCQYDSSLDSGEEKIRLRHFYPSRQKLLFVRELLRSYQAMLDGENSFARMFNVPLMSDVLVERITRLFVNHAPRFWRPATMISTGLTLSASVWSKSNATITACISIISRNGKLWWKCPSLITAWFCRAFPDS